jgi:gustatory receptor
MMTSLVQIDEERVRLSAAGLFKVGMHLIPAVSIATYNYKSILIFTALINLIESWQVL